MRKRLILLCCVMLLASTSAFALKNQCSNCLGGDCIRVSSGYLQCTQGVGYCVSGGGDCTSNGPAAATGAPSIARWKVVQATVRSFAPVPSSEVR
jgi:hypothetical protein